MVIGVSRGGVGWKYWRHRKRLRRALITVNTRGCHSGWCSRGTPPFKAPRPSVHLSVGTSKDAEINNFYVVNFAVGERGLFFLSAPGDSVLSVFGLWRPTIVHQPQRELIGFSKEPLSVLNHQVEWSSRANYEGVLNSLLFSS